MKTILLWAFAFLPCLVLAQPKVQPFRVNGKIGNLNAPVKAYLVYTFHDNYVIDSCVLKNGSFSFKGNIEYTMSATLFLSHDGTTLKQLKDLDMLSFYLEPGKMQLTNVPDSMKHVRPVNSLVNAEKDELFKMFEPGYRDEAAMYNRYMSASPELRKTADFQKEMVETRAAIDQEHKDAERNFVMGHPKSMVSLDVIRDWAGATPDPDRTLELYNALSPVVKNTPPGEKYGRNLTNAAKTAIGKIAPGFTQPDTSGTMISLSSFRGRYVLLDFWASWCGPCRAENPNVVKNYAIYHDKGLEILGVSLDRPDDRRAWIKAIQSDRLNWQQVSDLQYWKNKAAEAYGVQSIPQNFLIDPQGRIIAKNLRGDELDKKLAELIK